MLWLFRYIFGFLTVLFYGEFPEKILNIAASNRMFLWNSRLVKKGIECRISVKDFRNLPYVLRKSGIRVHILKKHGLPFKLAKNRKRIGIITGFAIFMIFLKVMSGYVWIIEVTGNSRVDKNEIISALEEIGIKEGVKRKNINSKFQKEKLLLEMDGLAWASLNLEGCRLTVNVSEIKNETEQSNIPTNLKAKADGIIKKIDVVSGNCIVKCGDTVKTGDVLVSGIIERQSGTEFVRSQGVITATTERSVTVSGKFKQKITTESGKGKSKSVLDLFSLKIPLYLGKENKSYNEYKAQETLSLFGQNLPVRIYKKKFMYTEEYTVTYTPEKLQEKLEKEIAEKLKKQDIKKYTVLNSEIGKTETELTLTQIISAEENIAVSEDIKISKEEN